jgi:cystathionine beta-lyase/cystathionine gamma-synthase
MDIVTDLARGDNEEVFVSTWPNVFPLYQTNAFSFESAESEWGSRLSEVPGGFNYTRDNNPTLSVLEDKLARLEKSDNALLTTSGMSALFLAIVHSVKAGDSVLVSKYVYPGTYDLFNEVLPKLGINSLFVDTTDLGELEKQMRVAKMLVVETISNPYNVVADIDSISKITKKNGVVLCVDNTYATPYLYSPIAHGANLVVESATKTISGHEDVVAGILAGNHADCDEIAFLRSSFGMTLYPFGAFLVGRGLRTLPMRLEAKCKNAYALSEWLAGRKSVSKVYYLGAKDNPQRELATQMFGGRYGSVLSIKLSGGSKAVERAVSRFEMIPISADTGGLSTFCLPWKRGEGILRFSVGIESIDDIISDIKRGIA